MTLAAIVVAASVAAGGADASLEAMLARVDAAQLELQNGRPEPFKALWSRAGDVTLAGGFGGAIEQGWDAVSRRLDWAASQFSNGRHANERVTVFSSGDLGYVIQREHLTFRPPGSDADATRDLRVTMIFRREKGEWRLVHRQADANTVKQPSR